MTTAFPTGLDNFTNPNAAGGDQLNTAVGGAQHDAQHGNANDAIEALEAKVGISSSGVTTSIDYKMNNLGGDATGSLPNFTVATVLGGAYPAVIAGTINLLTVGQYPYTVSGADDTINAPSTSSGTINFPAANAVDSLRSPSLLTGRRFTIRRLAGGSGVITLASTSTLNGPTKLTGDFQFVTYQSDGTVWNVINYGGPDVQTFLAGAGQTWTKPAGAVGANGTPYRFARVICIGPGSGGESGECAAASTAKGGGAGGSGGGYSFMDFPLSALSATETVNVGTGGAGGASVSAVGAGNIGSAGSGATTFGSHLSADFGAAGATAPTGGTGGTPGANAQNSSFAGVQGGNGGSGVAGVTGASIFQSPSGGGGGGGESGANVFSAGGNGGLQRATASGNAAGGAAAGAVGTAGNSQTAGTPAPGGGGGGGASGDGTTTAGGKGGDGGNYGAGGGGGGSSHGSGHASGAGGKGGDGICVVICY